PGRPDFAVAECSRSRAGPEVGVPRCRVETFVAHERSERPVAAFEHATGRLQIPAEEGLRNEGSIAEQREVDLLGAADVAASVEARQIPGPGRPADVPFPERDGGAGQPGLALRSPAAEERCPDAQRRDTRVVERAEAGQIPGVSE